MMMTNSVTAKIARNTLFQIFGKLVSLTITVLATIVITRTYGREGYGEFSLMQNIPALFFVISDFGFNAIASRELSKDFSTSASYLGSILTIRLFLSLLLMLIAILVVSFFPYNQSLKNGIYLSTLLILTQSLFTTTNIIFQVKLRYDLSVIGYVVGSVVVALFVFVLSFNKAAISYVNFSYVIGGVVTVLLNLYFLTYFLDLRLLRLFDTKIVYTLLQNSLPIGLMFIFSQINFKADSLLLSILPVPQSLNITSTEAVALYSLPYKIFEVTLVIPTFLMNSAYPVFVTHLMEDIIRFKKTFFKTVLFLLCSGIVIALIGILFSPLAVNLLGGPLFTESSTTLRLLLLGLPIFYLTQPLAWFLVTLGKQKVLPFIYALSAVSNVLLNSYFIPRYSFNASAVITWVTEFLILILLIVYSHKAWKNYQDA